MQVIINELKKLKISESDFEFYGRDIVKIDPKPYETLPKKGKLILMTSINPTAAGEGKTTTAIGLTDGLNLLGHQTVLALREPSLGPVLGRKGTATGGGESVVVPEAKINLHFTGDLHAISTANNLISAAIDNEIYWKSDLEIDENQVIWKRTIDLNDRSLRTIEQKISKSISRIDEFSITAASNMMTILTLAKNAQDLKVRIDNAMVAYDKKGKPVFVKDLQVTGAVLAVLNEAAKPNFVLTKYNSPTLIHCGPFANISIGTNSLISTSLGLKLADYTVIESGFGSDLGFEKFMNLVNLQADLIPDCVVMVVTLRALKLHNDFKNDFKHLEQHLKHVKLYNLNLVVAINFIDGDNKKS
ncbi:formate--tetrahydrofolate ligase [Spiroplasma clarkii]|uniref:formate--tetrahydrofolate ligase n=1 Tax=Spiroplasma clarkii TaxID=2139 RepID=UPI0011BA7BA6|nr:formate--tetrahydrofolate ligase [Spiroplasma clarkii]